MSETTIDPFVVQIAPVEFASLADFEAEFELIGSILRRGETFEESQASINSDMFHNTICRDIYNAMQRVREAGLILDVITVCDQLDRDGLLTSINYDVHIGRSAMSMIRERGNPKNISSYIEIVLDYWARRQIDMISQSMVTQSRSGRRAPDIISDARIQFDNLDTFSGKVSSRTSSSSAMASALYDHTLSASKGDLKGCPTGFVDLDKLITPMAGDLLLIAGRPGQGKSALLDTAALQIAQDLNKRVGIFSLEMSGKQVYARIASQICNIPVDKILSGKLDELEWSKYTNAIEVIEQLPIAINDQSGLTIPQLRTEARRMKRDLGGLDMIVLDYVQLMKAVRKYKNRNEEIGEITKGLKEIARELEIPIFAAAQMSRSVEQRAEKRPVMSDLRESGDLENDSDIVMFLYKPSEVDKQGITELIVAKHRNGPVGSIDLVFRGAYAKFENCSTKTFSPR